MDVRNSVCRWIFVTSALALPAAALAVQDCEINGQHVNPANGGTTEGKTGIIVLVAEEAYDKGVLTRRKLYKAGRLVTDEEYYADGSRK